MIWRWRSNSTRTLKIHRLDVTNCFPSFRCAYFEYIQLQSRVKFVVSARRHVPPVFSTSKIPPLPQSPPQSFITDTSARVCHG